MLPNHNFATKFGERILVWRWGIMSALGTGLTMFEIGEHRLYQFAEINAEVVSEIIFFGIFFPVIGGMTLSWIARTRSESTLILQNLELIRTASLQLAKATNWDELTSLATRIPQSIAPESAIQLGIYDQKAARFELAAESGFEEAGLTSFHLRSDLQACCLTMPLDWNPAQPLFKCTCQEHLPGDEERNVYCLPLIHGDQAVALLLIHFPDGETIAHHQQIFINKIAPDLAQAIERGLLQRSVSLQSMIVEEEKRRIARDLHDTVGHDLAFVRLKLDEITLDSRNTDASTLRNELISLQESVNSAYEDVRSTLKNLFREISVDLETDIREIGRKIGQRSHIDLRVRSEGAKRSIPIHERQQIFLIVKEILANVEKHSGARQVEICMHWLRDGLLITIGDDGVGFTPELDNLDGHYGLKLMQQRAEDIRAQLTISSAPGASTQARLWYPSESLH